MRFHLVLGRGMIAWKLRGSVVHQCSNRYDGFNGRDRQLALRWQLIALSQAVFLITGTSKVLFLPTFSQRKSVDIICFSDMGFGGPNICYVTMQLYLRRKHWELSPLWVSAVHGVSRSCWSSAESLSSNCPFQFSVELQFVWWSQNFQIIF